METTAHLSNDCEKIKNAYYKANEKIIYCC